MNNNELEKYPLEDLKKQKDLLLEFLGTPISEFTVLHGAGRTGDEEWRRKKERIVTDWVEQNRPLFPEFIQEALNRIRGIAGSMVTEDSVKDTQQLGIYDAAGKDKKTIKDYVNEIGRELRKREQEREAKMAKDKIRIRDIKADLVHIGDKGTLIQQKTVGASPDLQQFFTEIRSLIQSQQSIAADEKTALTGQVNALEAAIAKSDGLEVGIKTKELVQHAPFLKRKFEELVTGATGSMLATVIIEGIKLALGL
ncbi:MAG: hypothetical protein H8D67_30835 [Deltaproteobacteria bacterium]|nr:hypothetical protein [Deltaproteobacteria bacterium]